MPSKRWPMEPLRWRSILTIAEVPTGEGHAYRLEFSPEARTAWIRLDGSVRTVLWPLLEQRLDQPHVPGARLHGKLAGCYKIKLSRLGIRLIYAVEDGRLVVTVMSLGKRERKEAYDVAALALQRFKVQIEQGEQGQ